MSWLLTVMISMENVFYHESQAAGFIFYIKFKSIIVQVRTAFAAFAPDIAKYMEQEMNK